MTSHFNQVQNLCSRESFPLSLYIVLVQALHNDLIRGLTGNDGEFERVLGAGARAQVEDMIKCRFNMDGNTPVGTRKVGLLDPHHFWAYLVDPFNHALRSKMLLRRDMSVIIDEMINAYIPMDEDGMSTARARVRNEFMVRL